MTDVLSIAPVMPVQPRRSALLAITVTASLLASPFACALDSLPLDQLKPGLWKIDRRIERIAGGNPTHVGETQTRHSEYCVDPKQEILKTLRVASFLCKTEVTRLDSTRYEISARCTLPGISGESNTVITLHSATRYSAEVETKGKKFGEFQHRREKIDALRTAECKSG